MRRERVVVVGAGMVGHRVVEELVRRDPAGRFAVRLVGAEPYAPYNRILLSDVVAGRCDLAALALPEPDPARVLFEPGTRVVAVDREAGEVALSDGRREAFDHLVLATGARAFVPPLPGLTGHEGGGLPRHAHVLRTLDDCRDIAARALNARHAVVLGGGLLGLEAACGLTRRGVRVTLLQVADRLSPAQLDDGPSGVLAASLEDLGIDVRVGTGIAEVVVEDGGLHAVRLADGLTLPTDLLLVSCGIRPRSELAAGAGLTTGTGVVVDAGLRSPDDPRVYAVGDCAQPPSGSTGLVGQGWAQAAQVAATLTGTPSPGGSDEPLVRLKAAGVDLVTMGTRASGAERHRDRVVTISDPVGRRHVELVVRDERLTGVTCVGSPDLGAALSVAYERGTSLPADPLLMLLPERAAEEGSPALMPARTPVCRCNGVTKRDIVAAWDQGASTVPEVARHTRATTGCGGCREVVCGLVDWLRSSDPATSQPGPGRGEKSVAGAQHERPADEISTS